MTDASQPRMARGKLSVGILAAALFALLAFAPFASAAADPVASGTTTVTLKSGVVKGWKKQGVTLSKVSPAKLKGSKATFTVTGGSLDPTTGLGTVNLGGGLKFKAGKKSATVTALVLDTSKKNLTAKVAGKKMKMATIAGSSFVRNGFGVNLSVKSLKLTSSAAKQLNKKLGFTGKKSKKGKSHKRAAVSKGASLPFKANQVFGSASAETQPSTVTVLPVGNMTFNGDTTLLKKLSDVEVKVQTLGLTTQSGTTFTGPIIGGSISPIGTAGVVQSGIGLNLVQNLTAGPSTTITLGGMYVDLAAKTLTFEVIASSTAESPAGSHKFPLNLGNLKRTSIADITVGGVVADPTTRTVAVNGAGILQPVSAEVLEGFVQVYEGYLVQVIQITEGKTEEEAKVIAAAKVANDHIKAGEALGTFSFTAQTQ